MIWLAATSLDMADNDVTDSEPDRVDWRLRNFTREQVANNSETKKVRPRILWRQKPI
jgi:hypothetical protein